MSTFVCNLNLVKLPNSVPVQSVPRTILLGNHRSITDFFLHDVLTDFQASFLSRALVGVLFFPTFLVTCWENSVWFFIRGYVKGNPEHFYKWIDYKWDCWRNIRPNLLLYPEGHRNTTGSPLRLRTGMIRYAYSRRVPVQIYIAGGYDDVLNESRFVSKLSGTTVFYTVDEPIDPTQYSSEEEFVQVVESRFALKFREVFDLLEAKKD